MVEFVRDPETCEKVRFIQKLVQLRVVLLALLLGHQRHNKDTHYNSSEGSQKKHETDRVGQMILWMAFLPIYGAIHSPPPHQRQCDGIMMKQKTRIAFIARDELSQ